MSKNYVLFNPLAGNKRCGADIKMIEDLIEGEIVYCNMTKPETYSDILPEMQSGDILIVCGGDGTLNRFINLFHPLKILFPIGKNVRFLRRSSEGYC